MSRLIRRRPVWSSLFVVLALAVVLGWYSQAHSWGPQLAPSTRLPDPLPWDIETKKLACVVEIDKCPTNLCKGSKSKFRATGDPEGGTYRWTVVEGADKVDPDNGEGREFEITAQENGVVKIRVTYTVTIGGHQVTCTAECSFTIRDCANCNCYFDPDCSRPGAPGGTVCEYERIEWQDNCLWMKPKFPIRDTDPPCAYNAQPPNTVCCSERTDTFGFCDGLCRNAALGSACGVEQRNALANAVYLWGEACIIGGEQGGGAINQELASQALAAVTGQECARRMGRHVGSCLVALAGYSLFEHPEGSHEFQDHLVADLSNDPCLVEVLRRGVLALAAEVQFPSNGDPIIDTLAGLCPSALDQALTCAASPDKTECFRQQVHGIAQYFTTPPNLGP